MIYTLTLNPAVDRELTVTAMEYDVVLRAVHSRVDFGGKGFNVSRMLRNLGAASTATGFLGGRPGDLLEEGLRELGIDVDFVRVCGETRTNISVVTASHDHYLKVNEKGPTVATKQQMELLAKIDAVARAGDWWVLAGSLPPGVHDNFYARIVKLLNRHEVHAVLDTSGESLRLGCAAHPFLVKPNAEEAGVLTGYPVRTPGEIARAAAAIRRMGAQNVIVSMGKAGALLRTEEGAWLLGSPKVKEKNPIGAGDSLVGGLVWALTQGLSLRESLAWGVASGAATASQGGTGLGSRARIEKLVAHVTSQQITERVERNAGKSPGKGKGRSLKNAI
ncbi:MAG: 1-phosphofructokinase [Terracidiphilus sp.]